MPTSRKDELAFMMMEKYLESHTSSGCGCRKCKRSAAKKASKAAAKESNKDSNKDNCSPSRPSSTSRSTAHFCCDHKPPLPSRLSSDSKDKSYDKDKDKDKGAGNGNSNISNRNDKIDRLLKAHTNEEVLAVWKSVETTSEEHDLAFDLQAATAQCKTFVESKAKIIDICNDEAVDLDVVFGLLANFRQHRNILTSAVVRGNSEREKTKMEHSKSVAAIREVYDSVRTLANKAQESGDSGKEISSADILNGLGDMISKVHDLAKKPPAINEELLDIREKYLDLVAELEEQDESHQDIKSCHEKLHEDKKQLQEDLAYEKREHLETRRRLNVLSGTKNEVNQAHRSLEKVHEDNANLKKEVEKLNAELGKINALKHENTQLKKKVADMKKEAELADSAKWESKAEAKASEPAQAAKKKKGKKGSSALLETTPEVASADAEPQPDPALLRKLDAREKELKALQSSCADVQSQLGNAQTSLRHLEAALKKAETAKARAVERQQLEQVTALNWKELSEGHQEESSRLREQLEDSISHATTLQNSVHQLEQNLAETKDQLEAQTRKRSNSPSIQSQTSTTSRFDTESFRMLRKLRSETSQLVHDLDAAKNYPGDPWNLVECTRNMIAMVDHDIENFLNVARLEADQPSLTHDSYSQISRSDLNTLSHISLPRARDPTPPLSALRPQNSTTYRPLLPPGLAEPLLQRASPIGKPHIPHFPSPIGSGRPGRNTNGLTPSPTLSLKTLNATAPIIGAPSTGASIGNGAAGVDWSIWTKR